MSNSDDNIHTLHWGHYIKKTIFMPVFFYFSIWCFFFLQSQQSVSLVRRCETKHWRLSPNHSIYTYSTQYNIHLSAVTANDYYLKQTWKKTTVIENWLRYFNICERAQLNSYEQSAVIILLTCAEHISCRYNSGFWLI